MLSLQRKIHCSFGFDNVFSYSSTYYIYLVTNSLSFSNKFCDFLCFCLTLLIFVFFSNYHIKDSKMGLKNCAKNVKKITQDILVSTAAKPFSRKVSRIFSLLLIVGLFVVTQSCLHNRRNRLLLWTFERALFISKYS